MSAARSPVSSTAATASSKVGRAEQQRRLVLVGEQDVDLAVQQLEELALVALHAERVGQGQGHERVGGVGHLHGPAHGGLGRAQVPQVALEVHDLRPGHELLVEVLGPEGRGHPQVGGHRPLAVVGDEHQAPPRGPVVAGVRRRARPATSGPARPRRGMSWMKTSPSSSAATLPEEPDPAAERGHPGGGVGRRAARDLDGRPHGLVERGRPGQVDEGHATP